MRSLTILSMSAFFALGGAAFAQSFSDRPPDSTNPYSAPGREAPLYEGRGAANDYMAPGGGNTFTNGNMGVGGGPGIQGGSAGGR